MFRHYRVILRQPAINTLPSYISISNAAVGNIILYNEPTNSRNNFTNYHTATCFDSIVSSSGSLKSILCQVTPVFQVQLSVILFCTVNQQMHTIISQIITPLHVSTLSCHPQAACNQYFAKLHQYFK